MSDKINHKERAHAELSASASSRWLNCAGSVAAEKNYPDSSSAFAEEGILAHELADLCLRKEKEAEFYIDKKISNKIITKEMCKYVQEYIDYVLSYETSSSQLYIEERVDFSNVVKEGFGTIDSAVVDFDTKTCHIFDLKYGRGVEVDAYKNTQAQLYALGFYNELNFLDEIESFTIHIIQPRLNNIKKWNINVEDLNKFGEFVKDKSKLALMPNAPRTAGNIQCRWCKANHDCTTLNDFTQKVITSQFENIDDIKNKKDRLSNDQKKIILDNKKLIESFLKAVENSVFEKIKAGEKFEGYKIVAGRSIRKYTEDAEEMLFEKFGEEAYKKSLITITEAQKKLSNEEIQAITYKPAGKLALVANSDKRSAIILSNVENDFEKLD